MRRRNFTSTTPVGHSRNRHKVCPKCGRGNAILKAIDDVGISKGCRWCDYGSFRSWDEIYAEIDERKRDGK